MKKLALIAAVFVLVALPGGVAGAQESQGRIFTRVTSEETWGAVVQELYTRGVGKDQLPGIDDLALSAAVPAREKRTLRVSSVCREDGAGSVRFRVQCREPGACLPFLVYWRGGGMRAKAPSCRLPNSGRPMNTRSRAEPSVFAGQPATAVMTAAGLRMTASVTSLERGIRGEIVRVRAKEGRIFRARVTGPGTVEVLAE